MRIMMSRFLVLALDECPDEDSGPPRPPGCPSEPGGERHFSKYSITAHANLYRTSVLTSSPVTSGSRKLFVRDDTLGLAWNIQLN